jgi:neutral ceramidase
VRSLHVTVPAVRRVILAAVAVTLAAAHPASGATLQAGVGRADITPPTGFPTFGYVRDDAIARGQNTRLYARAVVLRQGTRRLALVTADLGITPGGLLVEVAARLASRGFDQQDIIVSASHTHSGPAGFANFQSDNFVAPTEGQPTDFKVAGDPQLYGFLVERVATAIVRADEDRGPARIGWGSATLGGVTDNRSLEAHLANFGYDLPYGAGKVSMDPGGYLDTIDPNVDVLRVDRVTRRRRIPLGAWLNFADHGTVNPYQLHTYNADHHGAASRLFERAVRRLGHVPRSQDVVGAYGNSDAGDMTAGLRGRGMAYAEKVGGAEAAAFLRAWRKAGAHMTAAPAFDERWTRSCFCGRTVEGGQVASQPAVGLPFLTGSEENRGPLFDVTGDNNEGRRLPADAGAQGRKIQALGPPVADFPSAVPLAVVRLGDRLIATVPGEMTVEMGRRTRAAVLAAAAAAGVSRVVLAGYANEYVHYFTTPEEYEMQHYEGGSTLFGKYSSNLIKDDLATLAGDLAHGAPAPAPYAFDPRNGLAPDLRPYDRGPDHGAITAQPHGVERLQRATVSWQGGPRGFDRPLDGAFVSVQRRRAHGRWRTATDDLGLEMVWQVDDAGVYTAQWQPGIAAPVGSYRFVVTANRYKLVSAPFRVGVSTALTGGRARLDYPAPDVLADITSRPDGTTRVFRLRGGGWRDRYGNRTAP